MSTKIRKVFPYSHMRGGETRSNMGHRGRRDDETPRAVGSSSKNMNAKNLKRER